MVEGLSDSRKPLERIKQITQAILKEADLLDSDYESDERIAHYLREIEQSHKRSNRIKNQIDRLKKKTQSVLDQLG